MVSTFTGSIGQQLTTTGGGSYSQTDSSPDWGIDDNAQELLNEAIASNYRSHENVSNNNNKNIDNDNNNNINNNKQTGSKRKSAIATDKLSDDSSSTSSAVEKRKSNKGGNSTGGPKRAGRRPLEKTVPSDAPLDPKQKRKEQNRAAQRAFRERKERHVTELQERIRELEEENASHSHLAEENALLKEQLQKLQEENYTLKGTPFTFEFPPKTAGIIHDDEYQYRSSNSTTSDSCGSLSVTGDKSSTSSNNSERSNNSESPSMTLDHLSSLEEDDDEEREAEKDQLHQQQQFQHSTHEQQQQQQQQLETPSSSSSSPQQQTEQQQQDLLNQAAFTSFQNVQELSIDDLLAPFANNTDNFFTNTATTAQNNNMLSKDQFAFTDYRVPQSADNFLFQADLPPLFGGDVDLFGLSAPAPNNDNIDPITLTNISNPFIATTASSPTSPATPPIVHNKPGCNILNQLREAKGQNPKAMEIDRQLKNYCPDFDLDNLCWELKEKAKCSENRFSEKDMGHIIDYFEKKGDCESGK